MIPEHWRHLTGRILPLVVILGMPLLVASANGQEGSPDSFQETIEVELVNVEVRVLDKQGRPVTGLSPEDFEVLHDGEPVSISNFTEFRNGVAAREASGDPTPDAQGGTAADHHLIVYFDELHLQATHRAMLIEALEEFIASERIPAANIMILRQGHELSIEAPFGSSLGDLEKVLKGMGKAPPGLSNEVATRQALDEIQRVWNQSRDATGSGERGMSQIPGDILGSGGTGTGGSPRDAVGGVGGSLSSGNVPSSCRMFESRVEAVVNSWMMERSSLISVTLRSLADSSTYLAGLPGTKSLLYFGDALETLPGMALVNYADTICPGGEQNLAMNALGEELNSAFLALTRHAAANRVTFYPVQGGGLQVSSRGSARETGVRAGRIATFDASRRAGDQSGLIMLAEETGGRAALNQNDYAQAFQELGTEMISFYSLAYQPPAGNEGPEHKIEVRMRDSALEPRYRRGIVQKSVDQRFSESLQGALYLGLVDNPLNARLRAGEYRTTAEGNVVIPLQVLLPVDLVSFSLSGDQLIAGVLVRVLSRDLESGQMTKTDKSFQVRHQPGSEGEWVQLPVELQLEPGQHLLAIGVLDQQSGVTTLVSTSVDLPAS
jgi:VWFA-related protein